VVAAHHRVHDHACYRLQADCLESGISSGPRLTMSMGTFTFTFSHGLGLKRCDLEFKLGYRFLITPTVPVLKLHLLPISALISKSAALLYAGNEDITSKFRGGRPRQSRAEG